MPAAFRRALLLVVPLAFVAALIGTAAWYMTSMPDPGAAGRPGLPEHELPDALRHDVTQLSGDIGERNLFRSDSLERAASWIEDALAGAGYAPQAQEYVASGLTARNVAAEVRGVGDPDRIVVIGAHYDSVRGSPGADDNASGVAATLALARRFSGWAQPATLRFVFFANEEPPHFQTDDMGSLVYARACRERGETITAMLSLESLGYWVDEEDSQDYPFPLSWFYPSTGNFVAVVGDLGSRDLVTRVVASLRSRGDVPVEGASLPGWTPGVDWSDHWAFTEQDYPAVMLTDTAPFRNPHYHAIGDTPDTLDYERMAALVLALETVIVELCREPS